MALHGQIMANNDVLGWWEARRTEDLGYDLDEVFTYECAVVWVPLDGPDHHPYPRHEFTIEHQYSKGAFALASKVLRYVTSEGIES